MTLSERCTGASSVPRPKAADVGQGSLDLRDAAGQPGTARLLELAEIDGRLVAVDVEVGRIGLLDLGPMDVVLDAVSTVTAALRTTITPGAPSARRAGREGPAAARR